MRSKNRLAVALLAVFAPSVGSTEEVVVVTATRTAQPLDSVGQSITVIDSQTLAARQSAAVVDLLRSVPGVSVARNGGIGSVSSVFIRGADSDHTVALIDGVKLNDPAAPGGGCDYGRMLTSNLARIEVLRGSQSVLWGSQAIGGVVNLMTIEPTDTMVASLKAELGSFNTRQLVGNFSQKFGRVKTSLGVSEMRTDGISAFSEARGARERDGFRNVGAHARAEIEISDRVSVDLRGFYADSKIDFDGFAPPTFAFGDTPEYGNVRTLVGYSAVNFSMLGGRLQNRVAAAYTRTRRANFDPSGGTVFRTYDSDGNNTRFEYQGTLQISERMNTTFGLETEKSRFSADSFGFPTTPGDARIDSAFAELVAQPARGLTVVAGLRHDRHDEFGGKTTAGGSLIWTPNEGTTLLRASFNQGFKAPSLYQLHGDYGNTLLRPETSRGGDLGITQRFADNAVELGVTYFDRETFELINFVSCRTPLTGICAGRPFGTYDNVARARSTGFEATFNWRPIDALTIQANISQIDAENRSSGNVNFGKSLARRPREIASALADYRWSFGLTSGVTIAHVGASFDNASNTRRVEGYDLVDLRLSWPLSKSVTLQARVENLLDERYETVYQYGTPGRATYLGARLNY